MTHPPSDPQRTAGTAPGRPIEPTKHQLALMIWLAVFPTLTVLNLILGDWLRTVTPVLRTFVLSTVAVPIVIYALMPQLHKLRSALLKRPPPPDPVTGDPLGDITPGPPDSTIAAIVGRPVPPHPPPAPHHEHPEKEQIAMSSRIEHIPGNSSETAPGPARRQRPSVEIIGLVIVPVIAPTSPDYVSDILAIATNGHALGDVGLMQPLNLISAVGYLGGGLLFGIAVFRAKVLPRWAPGPLTAGTMSSLLIPVLPMVNYRLSAIPTGIALIGLGYALWQDQPTVSDRRAASTIDTP